jgi:hypothetical protein
MEQIKERVRLMCSFDAQLVQTIGISARLAGDNGLHCSNHGKHALP